MSPPATATTRNNAVFGCSIAAAMVLLTLVAVIVPRDVIAQYRFLEDYIAGSGAVIPGIERLAAVSSFPEVTRLVVSLMWTLVPILTALYLLKVEVPESFYAQFRQRPLYLAFGIVVMAISVVLLAVLYDITPEDLKGGLINETVLRVMSTSRLGLGLIAGFFSTGIAGMVYMVLMWFFNVPRIYFLSNGNSDEIADARRAALRKKRPALMRNPLIAIPYALSIPLALFAPEDAFSKWSWARAWFDLAAQLVPIVGNYAGRSAFPEAAGVYFSIVIFMAPCIFVAAMTTPGWFDEQAIRNVRARRGLLYEVPAWIMALVLVFLAYFCVVVNPGYDFNLMPINTSRIALALFGPLFAGGLSAICLAGSLTFSRILLTRRG